MFIASIEPCRKVICIAINHVYYDKISEGVWRVANVWGSMVRTMCKFQARRDVPFDEGMYSAREILSGISSRFQLRNFETRHVRRVSDPVGFPAIDQSHRGVWLNADIVLTRIYIHIAPWI